MDEPNVGQAITSLKKETWLLKYGRRGKPKFCPFRLSNDETMLIWYVKRKEKQLRLSNVSRIMAGQRTASFQRYPRPDKEYQSFSLIYHNRSLDVICKDKDEADNWFAALRALISRNNRQTCDRVSSDSSSVTTQKTSLLTKSNSSRDIVSDISSMIFIEYESGNNRSTGHRSVNKPQRITLGIAFSDPLFHSDSTARFPQKENKYASDRGDSSQLSLSSAVSSPSRESLPEDYDSLKDVYIWGEGTGDGYLGGGVHRIGSTCSTRTNALLPKALKSITVLDVKKISCGSRHAVLVTESGEIYSWGEESGGRLGHGIETDVSAPKLIYLNGLEIESVACGENHTCALTQNGDLYTWGDGIHNFGLLGHVSPVSHWTPRKVRGAIEGMHISYISCGPWHTAAITSHGLLFTFGEGTFGALGHGDANSIYVPKEVEALKGLITKQVACGVWHTAAIVEIDSETSRKLFTWGNGDNGQLGHGNKVSTFIPSCVATLIDKNFYQVACGSSMTVALTTSGIVYTMGGTGSGGNLPSCVEGLRDKYIKEIACGSHHIAILNSKFEVYTWGKGTHGQLGHGDNNEREVPTLVEALSGTKVKSVVCGSNTTIAVCVQKCVTTVDLSMCSGCHEQFNFHRKLHHCYNCGLAFCKACSRKKSSKALLASGMDKSYRVCDGCYSKINNDMDLQTTFQPPKVDKENISCNSSGYKPHRLLSRLSFASSEHLDDSSQDHALLQHSGTLMREYAHIPITSSTSSSTFGYTDPILASHSVSVVGGQEASPISITSSPNRLVSLSSDVGSLASNEIRSNDYNRKNKFLMQEMSTLREQVEVLSHKARLLEAELERRSRQLKEATEQAWDEGEKNKATKEAIKSLTMQLDELVTRTGQGASSSCRVSSANSGSTFGLASGAY
uniref:PH, RCC1 and FYVE domains-containing protein 1-like n=1 Tax=Erigeron canadensis TaxID=72917 RepID=UPI001CB96274|nr:PH, RCC1 and FYVE domains-containing protein 1-like [Erigeron canadensis]